MKYYFYSAGLILLGIIFATFLPAIILQNENILLSLQIPKNNSNVAGIQKYNIPPVSKNIAPPEFSARAVLVKDLGTDTVLYQKDASIPFPIASTTKIMTALVASEYFKQNTPFT